LTEAEQAQLTQSQNRQQFREAAMPRPFASALCGAAVCLLALSAGARAQGDRSILPPLPPHPVIQRDLTLTDMRVDVRIDGAVARTTIRQTLRNDGSRVAEGQYMLPLPRGASVSNFSLQDGDTRLDAKLLPADEARTTYQEIVRTMRDPGLLEYQDSATYSVAVFPFQPGQSRSIEVTFQQALGGTTDLVAYQLPLRWAGWSRLGQYNEGANFVLSYEINSSFPLGSVSSPTYGVSVNRQGDQRAFGSYESRVTHFGNDFTLNIGRRTGEFAATMSLQPGASGEDGYFLLSLLAALPRQDKHVPKDVLFILDKSGSMEGDKIVQAKGALHFVLNQLREGDRFNILYYSDAVMPLFDGLREVSADNIGQAKSTVDALTADGGTAIYDALTAGSRQLKVGERPAYALFLTDGLPTVGNTNVDEIIAAAKQNFDPRAKLFAFGVGYDVNTTLLDSLSYNHHGTATYVQPGENLESKVSEFYSRMASPALVDVALDIDGLDEYDLMPRSLPDLFHNNEIFVTGRYRGQAARSVTVSLRGTTGGSSKTLTAQVAPLTGEGHSAAARLWATRKVSWLIDQVRLKGDNKELVDEIERLATRFGIVTPYTSFLITEPGMDRRERLQALEENIMLARDDESGQYAVGRSATNQANQAYDTAAAPQAAGQTAGAKAAPAPAPAAEPIEVFGMNGDGDYEAEREELRRSGRADQSSTVNYVGSQTFLRELENERLRWVDARYEQTQRTLRVQTYSDAYFDLLAEFDWLADYLAQGENVVLVLDGIALETTEDEVTLSSGELDDLRNALRTAQGLQ
jgi:Ca-activated chloride channel homolog